MADNVETLVMRFEPDDAASKRVEQSAQRLAARVAKLKKEIADLQGTARDLNKELDKDDKAFEEAIQNTIRLEKARKSLKDTEAELRREIDKTATARKESAEQARLYGDVESRTRAITGAVGFVGGAGGAQIERTVNIGAEVLASAEAVGLLKQELPELAKNLGITKQSAAALGIEAVALAGAFVVIKGLAGEITAGADATKAAVNGQIDALQKYNDFIQDATTDDLIARIEELSKTRAAKGQLLEDLNEMKIALETGLDATGPGAERLAGNMLKIGDALGIVDFGADDLNEALAQVTAELASTDTEFRLLTQAFGEGATAANDAAEREREYTAAKIEGLERERRIAVEAATLTQEQLDKRLESLAIERGAAEDFLTALQALEQTEQVVESINETKDAIAEMDEETRLLTEVAAPLVKIREDEAAAAEQAAAAIALQAKNTDLLYKTYQIAAAEQTKFANELAKVEADRIALDEDYAQKTLEIQQDRDLKLVQDAEKFALDRVNDTADFYKELAELDREYYEERGQLLEDLQADLASLDFDLGEDLAGLKDDLTDDLADLTQERLDALRDYNKEAQRAAEDHYKNLENIQRRAQNDIRSASARLDALAIYEAQKNAEEQLTVEKDRYDTEQKRREEDFRDQQAQYARERRERLQEYQKAEQDLRKRHQRERQERIQAYQQSLRDLDKQHQRERQSQIAAFNEKIRREDQQRALELQHQQQAWAIEDQRRAQQYQNERDQLNQHYSALLSLTSNGLYQIELAYQAFLDSMAAQTSGMSGGSTAYGSSGGGVSGGSTLPTPYAAGGYPPINRDVLVGERGPEIARFLQPARIYPNGERPSPAAGAQITINIDGSRSPMQTAYVTRRELEDLFRSYR